MDKAESFRFLYHMRLVQKYGLLIYLSKTMLVTRCFLYYFVARRINVNKTPTQNDEATEITIRSDNT